MFMHSHAIDGNSSIFEYQLRRFRYWPPVMLWGAMRYGYKFISIIWAVFHYVDSLLSGVTYMPYGIPGFMIRN